MVISFSKELVFFVLPVSRIYASDNSEGFSRENIQQGRRETIILNVGGFLHRVKWETIDKFPKSRLQNLKNATSESEWVG